MFYIQQGVRGINFYSWKSPWLQKVWRNDTLKNTLTELKTRPEN